MNQKTKLAVIGTVGLPANYGGFETLTKHLVHELGSSYDMTVYCSGKRYPRKERKNNYKSARLKYLPFNANGIQSIIYDTLSIIDALIYADVLLILGVAGAWILPFVRLFTKKKIIISIDGIEWKRDKWNRLAKFYLWWAEKVAVKYSHVDISDNESIQDYTAFRYGTLSRIIEYGADHVITKKPTQAHRQKYPFLNSPYAFKVCRIEPENNVHLILEAFSRLPKHPLVILGNWQNSEYGRDLKEQYAEYSNITLLDPIYHQETLDVLRGNAFVYIHGHSAGGTNPSLVEAMYLGLPVISFNVTYNRTTTENKAIYFNNSYELQNIIETASFSKLKACSLLMKSIADRRYTWKIVADKYQYYIEKVMRSPKKEGIQPSFSSLQNSILVDRNIAHLKNQKLFFENEPNPTYS